MNSQENVNVSDETEPIMDKETNGNVGAIKKMIMILMLDIYGNIMTNELLEKLCNAL